MVVIKPNPLFEKWIDEDLDGFVKFTEHLLGALEEYIQYNDDD